MSTVLITGGSRGIGKACVQLFSRAGYRVAFCYLHSSAQAHALAAQCPGVLALAGDVACADDAAQLVAQTERALGPLDLLINNAGVSLHGLLQETSEAEFDRLFAVNVKGTFLCCRAALPGMIRRQTGCILNLSSMWGQVGGSCEVAYSASKAAVIGLTRALAREVGPSGIRVNCIAPGVIDTDMNAALDPDSRAALCDETPLGRLGTSDEIARAALFLASEQASFITGQVLGVNGGFVI